MTNKMKHILVAVCVLAVLCRAQTQIKIKEPHTLRYVPRTLTYYDHVLHLRNFPGRCMCKMIGPMFYKIAAYGIYSAGTPGVDCRGVAVVFNMSPYAWMVELGISELFKNIYAKYRDPNNYIGLIVSKIKTHAGQAVIRPDSTLVVLYSANLHRLTLWINNVKKDEINNCERRLVTVQEPANIRGQIITVCSAVFDHFVTELKQP
jgi:hypothetical protein